MFNVKIEDNPEIENEINRHLRFTFADDEEYFEGQEIQAENAVTDYLFDNQLYYFAVDLFWNDKPIAVIAIEK